VIVRTLDSLALDLLGRVQSRHRHLGQLAVEVVTLDVDAVERPRRHDHAVHTHQPTVPPAFIARFPPSTGSMTPVTIAAASEAR
jgi:hypothetical protein